MSEQGIEIIVEALEKYGVPLLKLYAIMTIIGIIVFLVIFIFTLVTVIRKMKNTDKNHNRW